VVVHETVVTQLYVKLLRQRIQPVTIQVLTPALGTIYSGRSRGGADGEYVWKFNRAFYHPEQICFCGHHLCVLY
jgi:hypothetical protein